MVSRAQMGWTMKFFAFGFRWISGQPAEGRTAEGDSRMAFSKQLFLRWPLRRNGLNRHIAGVLGDMVGSEGLEPPTSCL